MIAAVAVAVAPASPRPLPVALPPNLGAHRLAWWLAATNRRPETLRRRTSMDRAQIERMLDGELVPSAAMAALIARVTAGAVRPEDWDEAAIGRWTDRPPVRGA